MGYFMWTGIFLSLIIAAVGNFSETYEDNCDCKWRLLKHYEARGCQIAQLDSCGCPTKYLCPQLSDTHAESKVCIYQNQEYKLGSRINVTDKCQSCRCLGGEQPQIVCRHKECPQLDATDDGNCHLVYEKEKCCPSKYECVSRIEENEAIEVGSVCVYDGVSYPLGARIYPSEDPCLVCICSENWQGPTNSSCYQQECVFEKNKMLFNQGCIPIYHENKCCPIELYCPNSEGIRNNNLPLENDLIAANIQNTVDGNCVFAGIAYEIGAELKMDNLCIKCNCSVPPDFTCVHQACPPPPDIKNCEVVVSTNSCCPLYECFDDDETTGNSSDIKCPTPVCNDASCEIKIPEGHKCPTCICDESIIHEKNLFEREENILEEGPSKIKNSSDSEELEKEFDEEVLSSVNTEFTPKNINESEVEQLEIEGNGTHLNDEDISREELDLSLKKFQESNMTSGEQELIKILRKRSSNSYYAQQQQNHIQSTNDLPQHQQQFFEEYDMDSNREVEDSDEGLDELKLVRKSAENEEEKLNKEDLFGSASIIVPAGCPTPLCANSSCKIEIPIGHRCPTCVCRRREAWEPR